MSQAALVSFIGNHFEQGKTQDEVREMARDLNVSDEQYAAALLRVLSQRLVEGSDHKTFVKPVVLFIAACVLVGAGVVFAVFLHGEFAGILGVALIVSGIVSFILGRRRLIADRLR